MGKIRVMKTNIGGSFGSSIQVNTVVPIAVAMALKTRRPIRLSLTREEDLHDHVSYSMIFKLKMGVKRSGKLTAGHFDAWLDIGGHQIQAYPLLGCIVGWWVSLYKLPAKSYRGIAVYTNKVPSCAFRGYGNPQMTWATECMMDELAEAIGMDPVDFRLTELHRAGRPLLGSGPNCEEHNSELWGRGDTQARGRRR